MLDLVTLKTALKRSGEGNLQLTSRKIFNKKFYQERLVEKNPKSFCCRAERKLFLGIFFKTVDKSHMSTVPDVSPKWAGQGLKNVPLMPIRLHWGA
jgi:hypothetical protein